MAKTNQKPKKQKSSCLIFAPISVILEVLISFRARQFILKIRKGASILFKLNNGEVVGSKYDDDKGLLSKILVDVIKDLGHPPSYEEAKNRPDMPENPNIYATYFGSLKKACEGAEYWAEASNDTGGRIRIIGRDGHRDYAMAYFRRRPYSTDSLKNYLTEEKN